MAVLAEINKKITITKKNTKSNRFGSRFNPVVTLIYHGFNIYFCKKLNLNCNESQSKIPRPNDKNRQKTISGRNSAVHSFFASTITHVNCAELAVLKHPQQEPHLSRLLVGLQDGAESGDLLALGGEQRLQLEDLLL